MQKTTVLIIDDQIGNNFKERLAKSGEYTVVGNTDNGDIGFAMAERYEPQVIILNIDMPHNKGVSLAEALSLLEEDESEDAQPAESNATAKPIAAAPDIALV